MTLDKWLEEVDGASRAAKHIDGAYIPGHGPVSPKLKPEIALKLIAIVRRQAACLNKISEAERMGYGTQRTYGQYAIACNADVERILNETEAS